MKHLAFTALVAGTLSIFSTVAMAQETLVFTTTNVEQNPLVGGLFQPWADRVNAAAKGAVVVELRNGQMLANHANYYDRLTDDVMQITWGMTVFNPGKFPRSLVSTMPLIVDSAEQGSVAMCRMWERGAFDAEMGDILPLIFAEFPQGAVHLKNAPITDISDVAGKKIMTNQPAAAAIIQAYGGAPLSIQLPEAYEALQRGTADGMLINFTALPAFKLDEVLTDHFLGPFGGAVGMIFMTRAKFDSLPEAGQAAILANSGCEASRNAGKFIDGWENGAMNYVKSKEGQTFTTATPEQVQALKDKMGPGIEAAFTSRVPDGEMLVEMFKEELAKAK